MHTTPAPRGPWHLSCVPKWTLDGRPQGRDSITNLLAYGRGRRRATPSLLTRYARQGKGVTGVGDRGEHALATLLHGALRQAHGRERGEAVRDVGLDLHQVGVDPQHGGRADTGEHAGRYDGTRERG